MRARCRRPASSPVPAPMTWRSSRSGSRPGHRAASRPPIARASPATTRTRSPAPVHTRPRRARRFQRYFTLTHLYNAGLNDEELQTYRNALAKLVNSLSWNPRIIVPVAVDPHRTVLRVDLRWFMWDAAIWNRVLVDYPYGVF